jgi:hypothetical protein
MMIAVKRVMLDVLKPHQPSGLVFASSLAELKDGYQVRYSVVEIDKQTETVNVEITGDNIDMEEIQQAIQKLGGSLHSIDEVEVINS